MISSQQAPPETRARHKNLHTPHALLRCQVIRKDSNNSVLSANPCSCLFSARLPAFIPDMSNSAQESLQAPLSGRYFLLLQGPQSHFFRHLSKALVKEGARVDKVNFCGGDLMLWGLNRKALNYTGTLYEWPEWIGRYYRERA